MSLVLLILFVLAYWGIPYVAQCIRLRCDELWEKASEERRNEYLELCVHCFRWYIRTGLIISRAYMPLFAIFERRWMGLAFEGCHVTVFAEDNSVCIGLRSYDRRKSWVFDIGACGMKPHNATAYEAAVHELDEELGINIANGTTMNGLEYCTTVMPCDGYGCILHIYICRLRNKPKLMSKDFTFDNIVWCDQNDVFNCMKSAYFQVDTAGGMMTKIDNLLLIKHGWVGDPAGTMVL